jgi:hypothetical protein
MSGVNFGAEPCPRGGIVDGAAMAIGDTDDGCQVDAEVGDEDWEVDSESDSEVMSGSKRLCTVANKTIRMFSTCGKIHLYCMR